MDRNAWQSPAYSLLGITVSPHSQCLRKRVQQLKKKRKNNVFLDFEKT